MTFNSESHKPLQIESFLPVWFQKIQQADIDRVRSFIVDLSVMRRVESQSDSKNDPELNTIVEKLDQLTHRIENLIKHVKSKNQHDFVVSRIALTASACTLLEVESIAEFSPGDLIELRFILPIHHHEEILALGRVLAVNAQGVSSLSVEFSEIAPDQADTVARYLIQRQLEQSRLKPKK